MIKKDLKLVFVFVFVIFALFLGGCVDNDEDDSNDDDLNDYNNDINDDNDSDDEDNGLNDDTDIDENSNDDTDETEYGMREFNQCLANNGIVIYGSDWCPACKSLIEALGGSSAVEPVYVDCLTNQNECNYMIGTSIPEIQINGELYSTDGMRTWRDVVSSLADLTGCEVPN